MAAYVVGEWILVDRLFYAEIPNYLQRSIITIFLKMNYLISSSTVFKPNYIHEPKSWIGHIPFAHWLIQAFNPKIIVELGTHTGNSYFAFCQTVQQLGIESRCYAVDTWLGDEHSGHYGEEVFNAVTDYHQQHYALFSRLIRNTFDNALEHFADSSIDLLHIDGLHTYEGVKHDFNNWLPKMSAQGVILFHDTNVHDRKFGVWQLFEELTTYYPSIAFDHSHGLGILFTGPFQNQILQNLIDDWRYPDRQSMIKTWFTILADIVSMVDETHSLTKLLQEKTCLIAEQNDVIREGEFRQVRLQQNIQDCDQAYHDLHETYNQLIRSKSWKMTKPLRKLSNSLRKRTGKVSSMITLLLRKENHGKVLHAEGLLDTGEVNTYSRADLAAMFDNVSKAKVLLVDASTPTPDQDSGSLDTFLTLKILCEMGYDVTFIPCDLARKEKYTNDIEYIGVRCFSNKNIASIKELIIAAGPHLDFVMLYRFNTARKYIDLFRRYAPQAKVIFNTVDLHFLREFRTAELQKSGQLHSNAMNTRKLELDIMRRADAAIVLSPVEYEIIREIDTSINLFLMPFFREIPGKTASFSQRQNIVFIGGFNHWPNQDAIGYFVEEIWPRVRERLTDIELLIIGSNPTEEIKRMGNADDRIQVIGYVKDLSEYFNSCKLTVAPLRVGSGIKGKVATSSGYGVPCVASSVAAEGMGFTENEDILIADDPYRYTEHIIHLYTDEKLWNVLSENALQVMYRQYSPAAGKVRLEGILRALSGKKNLPSAIDSLLEPAANSFWISTHESMEDDGRTRVIVELPSFDKGGMEKVVLDSVLAFNKRKYSILIVTQGAIGHLGSVAVAHNITIMQAPVIGAEYAYKRLIKTFRPHLSMSHFSYNGYSLFQEYGIPNITFIHNVYAFLSVEQKELFRKSDAAVTHYIAVSGKAAAYITENFFIEPSKITIIPNGISISEHENRQNNVVPAKRQAFGLRENDYVFLNPASYNLHKGHYLMADAMSTILETHSNIKILCVGNQVHSAHFIELKDHIKRNGLEKHMLMPGYVERIENVMVICDAVLMPSFIEGWSIAMNEAMFYEKPLILTNTGGASEVITDNDIGILLPNEYGTSETLDSKTLDKLSYVPHKYATSGELARAMINFADNRDFWKKRGALGREKIYRSYSFTSVVNSYECIMDKYAKPNH